ncbi:MAG: hypothetical protein HYS04_06275 [Acidobacteria bacterium]|nr:hypothetical protein [Acidobacteriota bacterium]
MKHGLLLLNLVLIALIGLSGWVLRERYLAARAREQKLMGERVASPPPPALAPLPAVTPVPAANYLEVAQKMLFARDRNPSVILDPVVAPAPKPVPPFPKAYGVLDLGAGPTAILAAKPGAPHHAYRAGEMVGEFKLVAMNRSELLFEWDGKRFRKRLEELADRTPPPQETPKASAAPPQPAAAPPPPPPARAAPGMDLGNSMRACVPGDSSPAGTVVDGMRKVVTQTPFGQSCRWEPVK